MIKKTIIATTVALLIGTGAVHSSENKNSYFKAGVSSSSIDLDLGVVSTTNISSTGFSLQMGGKNMFGLSNLGHGLEIAIHENMGGSYNYFLKPHFDVASVNGLNVYGKVGAGLWAYTNGGFAVSYGVGVDYTIGDNFGIFFEYGVTSAGDLSKTTAIVGISYIY